MRRTPYRALNLALGSSLALAITLIVAACGSSHGGGRVPLKPLDQAALQAALDETAASVLAPGAVAIIRTPAGEHVVTSGATVRGGATRPAPDTHFRIGSVTKTMTAAVILQLAQEGKLDLDDPVSKYRSDVPGGDDITIAQLLDMRSGLYNYTAAPDFWPVLESDRNRVWQPDELLQIGFSRPGTGTHGFEYCNTNTVLLGLIAEQLDGRPLRESFEERLFAPLGMSDTMLPAPDALGVPDPSARGYVYESVRYVFIDVPYPPAVQAEAKAGTLAPKDFTDLNPTWAWAAGGAISTAHDLATWIEALVGGKVLDTKYQRKWRDSLQPTDPSQPDGQQYGYGIAQLRTGAIRIFFHNGELPGFNTFAGYDPTNRVTIVVWTSLPVAVDGRSPAETIAAALARQIYEGFPPAVDPDLPSP